MTNKWFRLRGITKTPVVSRRRRFSCNYGVITLHGRPRAFGKLTKGERRPPKTYRAWYGDIELIVLEHRLDDALGIECLGSFTNEGMGQIQWKEAKKLHKKPRYTPRKIKFRKMLPTNLSEVQHTLLIAMLLHDFVHTEKHNSKIYAEVTISDDSVYQLARNHHNFHIDDRQRPLLPTLQYYDQLASSISRTFRWTATSRYRVSELDKIDFDALAKELETRQDSLYALYSYVYNSDTLNKINEALSYGFSSLKNHLLLMVNLYLDDVGGM
jgi:hypothetical protein